MSEEIKKDKGVKKAVVAKGIMLEDYKVLFTGNPQYRNANMIRSELHDIYTITINMLARNANDKRVIMSDGILTKAIGHYSLA
jgi:hypothetical protein